jgi:hypothetical protein
MVKDAVAMPFRRKGAAEADSTALRSRGDHRRIMLTSDDIRARVRRQPFVPVRIRTSDAQSYDVFHPDLIMIGRRALIVGTSTADDPATFEQTAQVSMLHVTAIEDLPFPANPGGNGRG